MSKSPTGGFVKLYRQFENWQWYQDNITKAVFIDLILQAKFASSTKNIKSLEPGQVETSISKIALRTGNSVQQTRTAISKLRATNEITTKSTNKNTLITIVNWGKFQGIVSDSNKQNTGRSNEQNNKQNNKQATNSYTIIKECIKNDKEGTAETAAYSPELIALAAQLGMTNEEYLKHIEELNNQ